MRILLQRVKHASVTIENKKVSEISDGLLAFLGVCGTDSEQIADAMLEKMVKLRIFADENDKTNLSVRDIGGNLLVVSQFTLYADCRKGNRPGFTNAAAPEKAKRLYDYFVTKARGYFPDVSTGKFGADMKVGLLNDGPFTVMLDSDEIIKTGL